MRQLRAPQLAAWLQQAARPSAAAYGDETIVSPQLLDVREPWEVEIAPLPGAVNIPMHEIAARHGELDASRPVVCVCHHGVRSMHVAFFLQRQGFDEVMNLEGGVDAWAREVDPAFPTY